MLNTVNDDRFMSPDIAALARLPKAGVGPAAAPIAAGDILSVTIFEAQSGGLFIPPDAGSRSGNYVSIPNEQVDSAGYITVPYAGSIKVAGLDTRTVSNTIANRLKQRAIEPQVVTTITERRGNEVSVIGEVNQPSRFALDPGGLKLSGAIAHAGGAKFPDYDTAFSLERRGVTYRANLSSVLMDPSLDVQVQPNDVLYLSHDPRFVMVFGATLDPTLTSISRRVTYESRKMNLAEAISKAGGLNTARADAQSMFVLRRENKSVLVRLGADVSHYAGDVVPTVYQVNFQTANGVFISDALQLRNRDIIVVSEAPYEDFAKLFGLVNTVVASPVSGVNAAAAIAR